MDAMPFCLALALAPIVPTQPGVSGWHALAGPPAYDAELRPAPPERCYWDAALRIWRHHPEAVLAESPQQMACDSYQYVSPAGEETASPHPGIAAIDGPPDAPR